MPYYVYGVAGKGRPSIKGDSHSRITSMQNFRSICHPILRLGRLSKSKFLNRPNIYKLPNLVAMFVLVNIVEKKEKGIFEARHKHISDISIVLVV